jgi:hypothetical protein
LTLECSHSEKNYLEHYHDPIYVRKTLPPPTQLDDFIIRQPTICRTEIESDRQIFRGWKRKEACNVAIYDAPGEATRFQETFQMSCGSVKLSDGLIVLIDPLGLPRVRQMCNQAAEVSIPRHSSEGADRVIERIMRFVGYNGGGRVNIPTAFVLTKSDELAKVWEHDSFKNEQDYRNGFNLTQCRHLSDELKAWLRDVDGKNIVGAIDAWFPQHCLFAVSSLGQRPVRLIENGRYELKVDAVTPKRLEEPFLWIMNRLGKLTERS